MHLSYWETLLRLITAGLFGSLIGFERERLLWTAGIRTHMLVCVGACLLMIVSAFGFSDALEAGRSVLDPSRVAAQVVSGIGFLGAGAILARGEIVRGLTTAASIWTVAAIGLAVGGGLYFAAAVSTALILAILAGLKPIEEAYRARNQSCRMVIEATHGTITPEVLKNALKVRPAQIKRFLVRAYDNATMDEVTVVLSRVSTVEIELYLAKVKSLPGVAKADVTAQESSRGSDST
jgi:putative Mg2+ transporter-C (MgtC) family protein